MIDGLILKNSFSCLFDLATNKLATVAEMYSSGWGVEGEAWQWRRRLLAWEEEKVQECCDILSSIVLQPNHLDRWIWHLHASNSYKVTSAYNHLLTFTSNNLSATHMNEIWKKEVPLKISLFLGYQLVLPENVLDHLYQFGTFSGFSNSKRSTLNLIWLSCVWVIWLERNARIFHQKEASFNQLLDKVKLQSYWWLKANRPSFVFSYHSWWLDPLPCLGIFM
ncbi:hypothetical protein MTR_2g089160 [Medicago truncatula]|uniref:Uncharacterized protein n=1 Tax=Medicago truncatula TaxID=3880 RepID=G7IRK0_MEDTR|nr:hypothetical protein MTR_2g089160 [Medicago truncatula]